MAWSVPYDDSVFLDTESENPQTSETGNFPDSGDFYVLETGNYQIPKPKIDRWKIARKRAKTRMTNPAARMTGPAGLTVEIDVKSRMVRLKDGRKTVRSIPFEKIDELFEEGE